MGTDLTFEPEGGETESAVYAYMFMLIVEVHGKEPSAIFLLKMMMTVKALPRNMAR